MTNTALSAGCQLAVEMFFPAREYPTPDMETALGRLGVRCRKLPEVHHQIGGREDTHLAGFAMKIGALLLSSFREVLFLLASADSCRKLLKVHQAAQSGWLAGRHRLEGFLEASPCQHHNASVHAQPSVQAQAQLGHCEALQPWWQASSHDKQLQRSALSGQADPAAGNLSGLGQCGSLRPCSSAGGARLPQHRGPAVARLLDQCSSA